MATALNDDRLVVTAEYLYARRGHLGKVPVWRQLLRERNKYLPNGKRRSDDAKTNTK